MLEEGQSVVQIWFADFECCTLKFHSRARIDSQAPAADREQISDDQKKDANQNNKFPKSLSPSSTTCSPPLAFAGTMASTSRNLLPCTQLTHTLSGHKGAVHTAIYNTGSAYLLTGGQDRQIKLWNPNTGAEIRTYSGHGYEVLGISWSVSLSSLIIPTRNES